MRAALAAVAVFAACGPRPALTQAELPANVETAADRAPEPRRVAVLLPMSGPDAGDTDRVLEGVHFAVERSADPVQLVLIDSARARDLGGDLDGVIGESPPGTALPQISPDPQTVGYSIQPDEFVEGELAAMFALDQGWKTSATLAQGDRHFRTLAWAFDHHVDLHGRNVTNQTFKAGNSVPRQLAAIQKLSPDVIFVACDAAEAGAILAQISALGMATPVIASSDWDDARVNDDPNAVGTYHVARFAADDPEVASFVAAFTERFDHAPETLAAGGHDAAAMLFEALDRGIPPKDLTRLDAALAMGEPVLSRHGLRFDSIAMVQVTSTGVTFVTRVQL
jgi:ABC-type branched-subunit amino acid transport system substrate-binding protein